MQLEGDNSQLGRKMKLAIVLACLLLCGCGRVTDLAPHWEVERDAVASNSHPFAGFWKADLSDNFGLAIGSYGEGKYYVSFCGPGGCFAKGNYRPITALTNDPEYRIIDKDTIEVHGTGWTQYHRSRGRKVEEP